MRAPQAYDIDANLLRIRLPGFSEVISLSVALKRPKRSFGGTIESSASSFTEGPERVYISVVWILACPSQRATFRRSLVACKTVSAQVGRSRKTTLLCGVVRAARQS